MQAWAVVIIVVGSLVALVVMEISRRAWLGRGMDRSFDPLRPDLGRDVLSEAARVHRSSGRVGSAIPRLQLARVHSEAPGRKAS